MEDNELLESAKEALPITEDNKLYYVGLYLTIRALQFDRTDHVNAFKQAVRCIIVAARQDEKKVDYKDIFELDSAKVGYAVTQKEIDKFEQNNVTKPRSVLGHLIWLEALIAADSIEHFPVMLDIVRKRFYDRGRE